MLQTETDTIKKRLVRDTAYMSSATVVSQVVRFIQSILVMRFLDPTNFGIWTGLRIILTYARYSHLGLARGLGIRVPYYTGKGERDSVQAVRDSTYVIWSLITLCVSLGVMGYAMLNRTSLPDLSFMGLIIIAGLVLVEQQQSFFTLIYSTAKRFKSLGQLNITFNIFSFLVIVTLTYFWATRGVMSGTLVTVAVFAMTLGVFSKYRLQFRIQRAIISDLFRIGFPIMVVGLGHFLILTIDRVLILRFLGSTQLGYYGVIALGTNLLFAVLTNAGSTTGPHINEEFGRSGDDPLSLGKFLVKPSITFGYVSAIGIGFFNFIVPPFVHLVLPKYEPGLTAFHLFSPGFFFLSVILTANNILNVILIGRKQQRYSIYIQVVSVITEVVAVMLFIKLGWGLNGAALGSTVAYAVYGLAILTSAAYLALSTRRQRLYLLRETLLPLGYCTATVLIVMQLSRQFAVTSSVGCILQAALQCLGFGILVIPLMFRLNSKTAFIQTIWSIGQTQLQRVIPRTGQ